VSPPEPSSLEPGSLDPSTVVVHAGRPPRAPGAPVGPGIELSSTYHAGGPVTYGREDNETWRAFEDVVGALEGGEAVSFASGLAAIAAVLETLPVGARVAVVPGQAYHGTRRFLADREPRLVVTDDVESADLLWVESPTNPTMEVADIAALCASARARPGVAVVVDNTFATPLGQRPLDLGADVVVHSATKLLSGHSDVLLGVAVSRDPAWVEKLRRRRSLHGAIPGPFEAWLALRGLRTLAVRYERSSATAAALAERLAAHAQVERVRYPGWGTILAFDVRGGAAPADAVCDRVRVAVSGTSVGGVESLVERRNKWVGEEAVPPGLIRLSVGLEHVDDLWRDLSAALSPGS
jgi:cystathionine gamma-synthase